jgi:hypothetical protein
MVNKRNNENLGDWLLLMVMHAHVTANSCDSGLVDGGLGMVAESGSKYGDK